MLTLKNLTGFLLCLSLFSFAEISTNAEDCNRFKCPGPLQYYNEIGCKPIYRNAGDCCAASFDCSHLDARKPDKCYVKNREYAIGESPRDEDKGACDVACSCRMNVFGQAEFNCAVVDCAYDAFRRRPPGCYMNRSVQKCCGELVCPTPNEPVATCQVDGKMYNAGDYFTPSSQPDQSCYCLPGFTGEFIEPFCRKLRCGTEINRGGMVRQKCIPVYLSSRSLTTGCNIDSKCPDSLDYVTPASTKMEIVSENDAKCTFGNLALNVGEELRNNGTDYSSQCLRCKCEVPPFLSCQQLTHEDCGYKPPSTMSPLQIPFTFDNDYWG